MVLQDRLAAKDKAQHGRHAMAPRPRAAMRLKVGLVLRVKAHPALKVKAMADEKEAGTAAVVKNNAATPVLTTELTLKTVPRHAALALKAVGPIVARKGGAVILVAMVAGTLAARVVVKTTAAMTATSCHATSILSKPPSLRD